MNNAIREYNEYVLRDVLGHIEGVTSRAMFGGYGLYLNGVIFGIITAPDELRFKVGDSNRAQYEEWGSTPFVFIGKKRGSKPMVMQEYLVPEEIQEDREKVKEWLLQSVELSKKK